MKRIIILLVFVFLLGCADFFAQSYRSGSSVISAEVEFIKTDHLNNTYVAGSFSGTRDFDPGPGVANLTSLDRALFLCKYNSEGEFVFVKELPTLYGHTQIEVDSDGNIYVSSDFYDSADLNPGTGVFSVSSLNSQTVQTMLTTDVYIVKLNSSGNFIWGQRFGTLYTEWLGMDLNSEDQLIVAMEYRGALGLPSNPTFSFNTGSDENIALFCLSTTGSVLWVRNIGGNDNDDWLNSIEVTPNDEILLSGLFFETTDLDPENGVANYTANGADAFISRYDPDGHFLSAQVYGGPGNQAGINAYERNGSLFAELLYDTQLDADAGPDVYSFAQDSVGRYVLLKDSLGVGLQWAIEVPFGDVAIPVGHGASSKLAVDELGNIYASYIFNRPAQVTIQGITSVVQKIGLGDAIFCKVNEHGTIAWYKQYGKENEADGTNFLFYAKAVSLKAPNRLVLGGKMQGSCDFDLGVGEGILSTTSSASGSFLVTLELTQDPGDLNGDGEVTSQDIYMLLDSVGCSSCENLDLNNDGLVTVADILLYMDLIDG